MNFGMKALSKEFFYQFLHNFESHQATMRSQKCLMITKHFIYRQDSYIIQVKFIKQNKKKKNNFVVVVVVSSKLFYFKYIFFLYLLRNLKIYTQKGFDCVLYKKSATNTQDMRIIKNFILISLF